MKCKQTMQYIDTHKLEGYIVIVSFITWTVTIDSHVHIEINFLIIFNQQGLYTEQVIFSIIFFMTLLW